MFVLVIHYSIQCECEYYYQCVKILSSNNNDLIWGFAIRALTIGPVCMYCLCVLQGLGALCVSMYNFLLPVIAMSTDATQEPHVYLGEDGLELWLSTLQSAPNITPELLQLYTNMPRLLGKVE